MSSTRERATAAAYALLKRGEKPSVGKIRAEMGPGGSDVTLNSALNEFWQELGHLADQAAQRPDIPEHLFNLVAEVWAVATDDAHAALADYRNEAKARADNADIALEEAKTELTGANSDIDGLRERLQVSQTSATDKTVTIAELNVAITQLKERSEQLAEEKKLGEGESDE